MQIMDWCGNEVSHLARFHRWWRERNAEDPDNFPLEMEPGEWEEQYCIWEG